MYNVSAVTKNSKAYKESKKKFKENLLAMDYEEQEQDDDEERKDKVDKNVEILAKDFNKKRKK